MTGLAGGAGAAVALNGDPTLDRRAAEIAPHVMAWQRMNAAALAGRSPFGLVGLELRENHRLITQGVYRDVRHPMYAALSSTRAAPAGARRPVAVPTCWKRPPFTMNDARSKGARPSPTITRAPSEDGDSGCRRLSERRHGLGRNHHRHQQSQSWLRNLRNERVRRIMTQRYLGRFIACIWMLGVGGWKLTRNPTAQTAARRASRRSPR